MGFLSFPGLGYEEVKILHDSNNPLGPLSAIDRQTSNNLM